MGRRCGSNRQGGPHGAALPSTAYAEGAPTGTTDRRGGLGVRVTVTEFMAAEGLAVLAASCQVVYDPGLGDRPADLRAALAETDGLIVRNRTRVNGELLAAAPRLRVVGRLGAGLDNLDIECLRGAHVGVVHAPGTNALATAEFTLAMALALARGLRPEWLAPTGAAWADRPRQGGFELCGRTLGLVGLGRVGQAVARRARALGLTILATQPGRHRDDPVLRDCGAALLPLPDLLRRADVISLHASLTPGTHHLIGRRELALVRPGALLINTARGGLLDEAALATALREGWLAGAALDVRDPEPPPVPDPLDGLPGLIRTPHVAGLTEEAQRLTAVQVATAVVAVLTGAPAARPTDPQPALLP